MVEILKAILFGIVEGITEWLPISSTGHMILLDEFVTLNVSPEFWDVFLVVIQLGAILAVVVIFWKQIWPFGKKDNRKPLSDSGVLSYVKLDILRLWFKILVACVPAAVIGLLFDETFEKWFYNYQVVSIALIVFGVAFIVIENWNKNRKGAKDKNSEITYKDALIIGVLYKVRKW